MFLKLKNEPILEFQRDEGFYKIIEPERLPFGLRDMLIDTSNGEANLKTAIHNNSVLMGYFRRRSLSINREHAKKLLNGLHLSQSTDDDSILSIMILCKALSVVDDYWISRDSTEKWEDVNLRDNPLHETIGQIALTGMSPLTITGDIHTPELTGLGAYAKAWRRENGALYLYKASSKGHQESLVEVEVSNILDYTNASHVKYQKAEVNGLAACRCKSMCNDFHGIVSAEDVKCWCNAIKKNFDAFVLKLDAENYYKTLIVDYLVSNSDRHGQNWGFYLDYTSGKLTCLHPLFDHNNSFNEDDIQNPSGGDSLMMLGKSKKEAAAFAVKRCKFIIKEDLTKKVFLSKSHYDSFFKRASELGLAVHKKSVWSFRQ